MKSYLSWKGSNAGKEGTKVKTITSSKVDGLDQRSPTFPARQTGRERGEGSVHDAGVCMHTHAAPFMWPTGTHTSHTSAAMRMQPHVLIRHLHKWSFVSSPPSLTWWDGDPPLHIGGDGDLWTRLLGVMGTCGLDYCGAEYSIERTG